MPYVCSCGKRATISFTCFLRGQRCQDCGRNKATSQRRLSYEFVKETFAGSGYTLLESNYKNAHQRLTILCPQGHRTTISWATFQQGKNCQECNPARKPSFEEVREFFQSQGCVLLTDHYDNSLQKLTFICKCGRKHSMKFAHFKQGHFCKSCGVEKRAAARRIHSIDYVRGFFAEQGCVLLSTEYTNSQKPLRYICSCGEEWSTSLYEFSKGSRCRRCASAKTAAKFRLSFDFVKEVFRQAGCELLEKEYINSDHLMKYRCSCGNVSSTRFSNFYHQRTRCKKCAGQKIWATRRHHDDLWKDADFAYLQKTIKERRKELGSKTPKKRS